MFNSVSEIRGNEKTKDILHISGIIWAGKLLFIWECANILSEKVQ